MVVERLRRGAMHSGVDAIGSLEELGHAVHQAGRARRRCLVGRVRDVVGDAAVDLVAHTGDDRHTERRDRTRDPFGVERREVEARAAAAHERDEPHAAIGEAPQRALDLLVGPVALHPRVDEVDPPRVRAALELGDEVVIRRAAGAGDEPDVERHQRQRRRRSPTPRRLRSYARGYRRGNTRRRRGLVEAWHLKASTNRAQCEWVRDQVEKYEATDGQRGEHPARARRSGRSW